MTHTEFLDGELKLAMSNLILVANKTKKNISRKRKRNVNKIRYKKKNKPLLSEKQRLSFVSDSGLIRYTISHRELERRGTR